MAVPQTTTPAPHRHLGAEDLEQPAEENRWTGAKRAILMLALGEQ